MSQKRSKVRIVAMVVLFAVMAFVPPTATATNTDCWPGGESVWIDGYTYCMVEGDTCLYCEVVHKNG